MDYMPLSLVVVRKGDNKTIGKTASDIAINNPHSLNKTYVYFSEAIAGLKKGLLRLSGGYLLQDRELIGRQSKEIIENYTSHLFLRAGDDLVLKKQIVASIEDFNTEIRRVDDFARMTRGDFAKLLLGAVNAPLVQTDEKKWIDELGAYKDVITTLRKRYNFAWKDSF